MSSTSLRLRISRHKSGGRTEGTNCPYPSSRYQT